MRLTLVVYVDDGADLRWMILFKSRQFKLGHYPISG